MADQWAVAGVDLHVELDPALSRRAALERALRDAVRAGRLAPGARLPATRKLALELGLARNTVAAAYDQLVAEGYLTARRGAGTQVAPLPRPATPTTTPAPDTPRPRHDLTPGSPDVSTFPAAAWSRATRRALAAAPASAHGYGDPRGRIELRAALTEYLGRTRGVQASPERIVVTSGYVQALALLASVLDGPVAMEDPGLPFHRDVVTRTGRPVVPLPVDDRGATPPGDVAAAVVTPAHQYPTGVPLHPARRNALTAWARESRALLVEDDYDGEFRYDRQPLGAVQGTAPDHVVYAGSASKTIGPGVRLGWLVLPPRWVDPVVDAKLHADHHTEVVGQLALADLIGTHAYDRHIRGCRLRYRRRRDLLVRRLDGLGVPVHGVSAGLHVLVEHPDETAVLTRAAAHGLALSGLRDHHHDPRTATRQGLVVGYATPPDHAYRAALDALTAALTASGPGPR
ncbi:MULTISPECIES: MocR-like pyridoxine biosynthesis transcription factor PdxR [Saccharothrix]|uniref:MocR-like pyridoxine biosynthesis transcription factor PdxR n=1 Tax=Saccharothrix TaxID=2071 RepID=UPI00093A6743|nr:PLP-dependent aminotransferase family protein [Saccharothrix sp. CB00851]OKI27175.1 GntR family transcriptional regulator [Saccharothrix sp. CB00851]